MLRHLLRFVQPLVFSFAVCLTLNALAADQDPPTPAAPAEAAAPKPDAPPPPTPEAKPAAEAAPAEAKPAAPSPESTKADEPAKPEVKEAPKPDATASEAPKPAAEPTPKPADAKEPKPEAAKDADLAAAYAAKLAEWKEVLKELRQLRADFKTATPDQAGEIQTKWQAAIAKGEAMIEPLCEAGKAAYLAAPNKDSELTDFLVKVIADDVARDNYEPAADLSKRLLDNGCDKKELFDPAGIAAGATNDFESAEKQLKRAQSEGKLGENGRKLLDEVANYKKYWAEEQEIRKKEAAANDLPRVRLSTSKGDIVIELFENEAPEAVGNFISLVEQKFYDGLSFHRVLPGFMAQGGCPRRRRHGRSWVQDLLRVLQGQLPQALPGHLEHGARRQGFGRVAVLPHVSSHAAPEWQTHGVRPRDRGDGRAGQAAADRSRGQRQQAGPGQDYQGRSDPQTGASVRAAQGAVVRRRRF